MDRTSSIIYGNSKPTDNEHRRLAQQVELRGGKKPKIVEIFQVCVILWEKHLKEQEIWVPLMIPTSLYISIHASHSWRLSIKGNINIWSVSLEEWIVIDNILGNSRVFLHEVCKPARTGRKIRPLAKLFSFLSHHQFCHWYCWALYPFTKLFSFFLR